MADGKLLIDCSTGDAQIVPLDAGELAQRDADRVEGAAESLRVGKIEANTATLRQRAASALATNKAWLALPALPASPSNAQVVAELRAIRAQLDAITQQSSALVRLQLAQLDTTD